MRTLNQNNKTELTLPEALSRLRLLDDELMRTALHDQKELVQYILRIIMQMPGLSVIRMETQKDMQQSGPGRSLALDVWAVDADGTHYDIEIQRDSSGATGVRARYHGAVMDTAALRSGENVKTLPRTRLIFITETDCIGDGRLLHTFSMWDRKADVPLDTGQEILYLNTAFDGVPERGEEEIAALAHDFRCTDPADMILEPLADRMRFLKNTEKGRAKMSSVVEQYARQQAEKAAEKAAAEERQKMEKRMQGTVRKLFATGKHTPEEIADITGLSFDEINALCGPVQA